jgi:hypothetical protein
VIFIIFAVPAYVDTKIKNKNKKDAVPRWFQLIVADPVIPMIVLPILAWLWLGSRK